MGKTLSQDIKILSTPLLILGAVVIVFIISAKVILDNISTLNSKAGQNQQSENQFQTKLNTLQTVNQQVSSESIAVITALPATNPVLTLVSQIKIQSLLLGLTLNDIKSSKASIVPGTQISTAEIDFNIDGSYVNIASFISKISNSVPVNRFDTIRINSQSSSGNTLYRLSATLFPFWAPLPTQLPSIDAPVTELTSDEKIILGNITSLQQPSLNEGTVSATPTNPSRTNPFSL
jgi:Tfp pilus assembly protein PilO